MSVTYGRSVVFSWYSGGLHQSSWPPRYDWKIVESSARYQKPMPNQYVYELYKQPEKRALCNIFKPLLQRVQMNFIISDNVRIHCCFPSMSYSENYLTNAERRSFINVSMLSSVKFVLILIPFLTVTKHELCTRQNYIVGSNKYIIQ